MNPASGVVSRAVDLCGSAERRGEAVDWALARRLAHDLASPAAARAVPLDSAVRRILAAPVRAAVPLPGFDNAAMDGYAVHGPGPWQVVDRVLAGCTRLPASLTDGTAVEIATGAPVPRGTDRVVPYEAADRRGDTVSAPPDERRHVRRRGEYARPEQVLVPAGARVTPPVVGLAAAVGLDRLTVHPRPRLRVIVSGNELVTSGRPGWGRVRDAIGPMLHPLLASWGAEMLDSRLVGDEPDWFAAAVADSIGEADVTVVCGASSVGPADGLHRTLERLSATVHVDGVACRPGHPQVLAQLGPRWLVGLPGNPYAALVGALTLVEPLLAGLTGASLPDAEPVPLRDTLAPDHRRTRILPVRWSGGAVRLVQGDQPGFLGGAAVADGFAVVPPGWCGDERVGLLRLPS
ncbi:molybdopterin molybdotransferase MoeA [Micromonospora aurantiaca (nom. illeg.)]|uniref:molybdopterin molybdotransferase MoeA n=1 Tax=Micromonospora aurantiaca (nom. illeg.) TaxID=47850 RepID=UPI0033FBD7D8